METENIRNEGQSAQPAKSGPESPSSAKEIITKNQSISPKKEQRDSTPDSAKRLSPEGDKQDEQGENGVSTSTEFEPSLKATIEVATSELATEAETTNHQSQQITQSKEAADIIFHPQQEDTLVVEQVTSGDGVAQKIERKKKRKKNRNRKNKKTKGLADDGTSDISKVEENDSQDDADLEDVNGQLNRKQNNFLEDSDAQDKSTMSRDSASHGYEALKFTPLKDVLNDSFFDDKDSSEDEGMPDYKIGGYHPVHVGEILMDRYVIIQKLGWGHFSTVWLTKDLKFNSYVAIKVQKSAQHYLEAAYDEVEILDKVANNWKSRAWAESIKKYYADDPELLELLKRYGMSGDSSHCVQLLNSFIHHGPNGKHFIMVFEILGVNFLELIKRYNYKGVPLPLVRKLARQCLIGLDYMHRMCNIIHTDFKPENVVIGLRDEEVAEIAKTGQLTTTKMFHKANWIKKLNMKVAGTLQEQQKPAPAPKEDNRVWGDVNMEGLSREQKKKLRKKLQRKRKKLNHSHNSQADSQTSSGLDDEDAGEAAPDVEEVNLDDVDVKAPCGKKQQDNKKKATTDSLDRGAPASQIDNLIPDLNSNAKNSGAQAQEDNSSSRRGPKIRDDVQVKICDMGNGCWTYHHFTPEIQTRQYRSPEVIIGADYNTSADIWSFACTIFEMITGDFLFEPRKGGNYDKDDDHLAQMMELLGRMPKNLALSGKHSRKFFDSKGNLRRINGLCFWPLKKVLTEKYKIRDDEAHALSDFLLPMLEWHHDRRATAQQMLDHPWLKMPANYNHKLTEKEHQIMQLKKEMGKQKEEAAIDDPKQEMNELIDSEPELYEADDDFEDQSPRKFHNNDLGGRNGHRDERRWAELFDSEDELSLEPSPERRRRFQSRKDRETKINNSFTGPYPVDPTDFNHNDKGPNAQFLHYLATTQSK